MAGKRPEPTKSTTNVTPPAVSIDTSNNESCRDSVREIILNLLSKGAEIVPTEDIALLEEEYEYISRIIKAEAPSQRALTYKEYESRKGQLMIERDGFIARTINETLKDGEVGLLFIGVYHDVVPYLAEDIAVEELKEREKVKAYFDELMYGRDERNFEWLTTCLTSPVDAGVS